jgi:hypothetical protein
LKQCSPHLAYQFPEYNQETCSFPYLIKVARTTMRKTFQKQKREAVNTTAGW